MSLTVLESFKTHFSFSPARFKLLENKNKLGDKFFLFFYNKYSCKKKKERKGE